MISYPIPIICKNCEKKSMSMWGDLCVDCWCPNHGGVRLVKSKYCTKCGKRLKCHCEIISQNSTRYCVNCVTKCVKCNSPGTYLCKKCNQTHCDSCMDSFSDLCRKCKSIYKCPCEYYKGQFAGCENCFLCVTCKKKSLHINKSENHSRCVNCCKCRRCMNSTIMVKRRFMAMQLVVWALGYKHRIPRYIIYMIMKKIILI